MIDAILQTVDKYRTTSQRFLSMKETVYKPDYTLHYGWRVWGRMIADLAGNHELIWRLMIRELSAKYRQSLLGWVWAVILPVINVIVFTILRKKVVPISDTGIPYQAYVFWGTTMWQLFAQSLVSSSNALVTGANMVSKIRISKETLVIASIGPAMLDFVIRVLLTLAVFLLFKVPFHAGMLIIPLLLIPYILLTVGIGLFLSLVNSLFRDIASVIPMLMAFAMLCTPSVVYPPAQEGMMKLLHIANPVSVFITATQNIIAGGSVTAPLLVGITCAYSIVLFFILWYIFYISSPRIAERI